jgi:hypothetical protein
MAWDYKITQVTYEGNDINVNYELSEDSVVRHTGNVSIEPFETAKLATDQDKVSLIHSEITSQCQRFIKQYTATVEITKAIGEKFNVNV